MQTNVANFFTSANESSAREIIKELDAAYVVVDQDTATGKFWAIITWAGKNTAEYFDYYLVPNERKFPVSASRLVAAATACC